MIRILTVLLTMALAAPGLARAAADNLGPGDTVHVTVFQQPDLTTDARISDAGAIAMPLIGAVKITGQSTREAADTIAKALKDGQFLKAPQVAVALTTVRSRQVSVLGMVPRPGRYPIEEASMKLPDLIAAAGGIAAGGAEDVTVMRDGKSQTVNALAKEFELKNGDTVVVERLPVFYIYGEVIHAGAYPVKAGMTVMQAISVGGGITPRGSENRIKVRRAEADGKTREYDAKLVDVVRPDDVIFVKEALF